MSKKRANPANRTGKTGPELVFRHWSVAPGGASRDRTDDLKLAKLALSQLSYGPFRTRQQEMVGLRGFEPLTSPLSGVRSNQLSYRPIFIKDRFFTPIIV